jgi:hypothetical protein
MRVIARGPRIDRQQGFAHIGLLVAFLITVVGAVGYIEVVRRGAFSDEPAATENVATSTIRDGTSGWKTYRNEKYGFEIQIPNDWTVEASINELWFISPETKNATELNRENCSRLGVGNRTACIVEWIPLDISFSPESSLREANSSTLHDVVMSSLQFKTYNQLGLYDFLHYEISSSGRIYNFSVASSIAKLEYDAILSTLKLIEPTDTSTWKTYRNEEYGFEFEYPPEWIEIAESREPSLLIEINKEFQPLSDRSPGSLAGFCKLHFHQIEKSSNETIGEWAKPKEGEPPALTSTPVTIDSRAGLREVYDEIGLVTAVYLQLSDTRILSIGLLCGDDVLKTGELEFDQILSTLKFLDPE